MAGSGSLDGALAWARALPEPWTAEARVDAAGGRVCLPHARVEGLAKAGLRQVKGLELREWATGPRVYDLRLTVRGWRLRVDATPRRLELGGGRYALQVATPDRVEVEGAPGSALLLGALRLGAGRSALQALARRLLPPDLQWDGQVLRVEGRLPAKGAFAASRFESAALVLTAEHTPEGLWLAA